MPWQSERIPPDPAIERPPPRGAPAIRLLIVANLIVFGLEWQFGDDFLRVLALWPLGAGFEPWQIVTSAFLHGSVLHLLTNMYGLWMFGTDVERVLGSVRFLKLYGVSVLTAAATQLAVTTMMGEDFPTLGASGGVFGVLVAFAMLFPTRRILLLLPPIPMSARVFVLLYAAFELFSGVYGLQSGVAHFAHLGGLAGGLWLMRRWRRQAQQQG